MRSSKQHLYSITSSAIKIRLDGTSMPSARAVDVQEATPKLGMQLIQTAQD